MIGLQRGDEGKGRIVDAMSDSGEYAIVARFNGGPNAGHTISYRGQALALHQLPSGIRHPEVLNIIGNGTLVDLGRLALEADQVRAAGLEVSPKNVAISYAAHLILPHHVAYDELREHGSGAQGSTKRGIAFVAADKYRRSGLRAEAMAGDLRGLASQARQQLLAANLELEANGLPPHDVDAEISRLLDAAATFAPYVTDTVTSVHEYLASGKRVLAEGAQAASLDIEQGAYPYVSSSHTTAGGILTGLGVGPRDIRDIIGVVKATKSHVGGGPFPTEILDIEEAQRIRGVRGQIDSEYGASTGRPRRIGYLDLPELRRAILVNGVTELALNKLDWLPRHGNTVPVAVSYQLDGRELRVAPGSLSDLERCEPVYTELPLWQEDVSTVTSFAGLPPQAREFVDFVSDELDRPVTRIGVGPHPDQIIHR